MNKVLVLESSLITVWAYPERRMIHHQMKAFCFGDGFRDGLTRGVESMERYGATKWLSDDRANSALTPDDIAWSADAWFPRAKAAGWKHWGIVQPLKVLGQTNLARIAERYALHGIVARMFAEPDEAMQWLESA